LAFYIAFDTSPERNGIWTIRTNGSQAMTHDLFGAYRWRRDGSLVVFPISGDESGSSLWQVDVTTGDRWRMFDLNATPIRIANNDWQVSPDGYWILFRSADDLNLWVVSLPEP
jgi:hypothetical protein